MRTKRLLTLLLSAGMVISLAACAKTNQNEIENTGSSVQDVSTEVSQTIEKENSGMIKKEELNLVT